MSSSFHSLTIVGNLGRDPELRFTPGGQPVCTISVASTRKYSKADQVITLQDAEPKDASQAIEWLNARNERMVDDGDKILALHNGSRGGTWNCIHYAEKMARPIHNAWPAWVKVMWPPKPKPVQ